MKKTALITVVCLVVGIFAACGNRGGAGNVDGNTSAGGNGGTVTESTSNSEKKSDQEVTEETLDKYIFSLDGKYDSVLKSSGYWMERDGYRVYLVAGDYTAVGSLDEAYEETEKGFYNAANGWGTRRVESDNTIVNKAGYEIRKISGFYTKDGAETETPFLAHYYYDEEYGNAVYWVCFLDGKNDAAMQKTMDHITENFRLVD